MSWLRGAAGYEVFFNRDERTTRAPGLPPTAGPGQIWLAPRDGDAQGTWIGVNHYGLTLGLLNRWEESPAHHDGGVWVSRGQLVLSLLDAVAPDDVASRLRAEVLPDFRPFSLVVFSPTHADTWAWDYRSLSHARTERNGLVQTSSGFDQAEAARVRGRQFADAVQSGGDGDTFEALHRSHWPERGALSICMHRPEASTVSYTRVRVGPERVELVYVPGPPCVTTERMEEELPRSPSP